MSFYCEVVIKREDNLMPNDPENRLAFYETINDMVDAEHDGQYDLWHELSVKAERLAYALTNDNGEAQGYIGGALLMARHGASTPTVSR